jgi:hypothetical protein
MAPTPPPPSDLDQFGLGAFPSAPDPEDHLWHVQRFVGAVTPPIKARVLLPPFAPYDQFGTNRCVGFHGATSRTITEFPDAKRTVLFDANELYCQTLTGGHGACDPMAGTNARVMLAILKNRGAKVLGEDRFLRIDAYSRLWGLGDIKLAITAGRPASVVVKWPWSWFRPRRVGSVSVVPTPGSIAGLHLTGLVAYDDTFKPAGWAKAGGFLILNTYGNRWGTSGAAWVSAADLTAMLIEAWTTFDHLDSIPPPEPEEVMQVEDWTKLGWRATLMAGTAVEDAAGHPLTTVSNPTGSYIGRTVGPTPALSGRHVVGIDTGIGVPAGSPPGTLRHVDGYLRAGVVKIEPPVLPVPPVDPAVIAAAEKRGYNVAIAEEQTWAAGRKPKQ